MITWKTYLKTFKDKEVILTFSDLRQFQGKLVRIWSDGAGILPRDKKTPIIVPFNRVLYIEEAEK